MWQKIKTCTCCDKKAKSGEDDEVLVQASEPSPWVRSLQSAEKYLRPFLPWLPFALLLCIANNQPYAACWTAFGVSLALNLNDFLQARLVGGVLQGGVFPTTLNFTSLVVYILIIIVVNQNPAFKREYIGPVAATFLVAAVLFSMVFSRPFTQETTASWAAEDSTRTSAEFLKFNQILTGYVLAWLLVLLVCIWVGATVGVLDSALQVVLSIIVPVLLPLVMFMTLPGFANRLRGYAEEHANESDRQGLLQKDDDGMEGDQDVLEKQ